MFILVSTNNAVNEASKAVRYATERTEISIRSAVDAAQEASNLLQAKRRVQTLENDVAFGRAAIDFAVATDRLWMSFYGVEYISLGELMLMVSCQHALEAMLKKAQEEVRRLSKIVDIKIELAKVRAQIAEVAAELALYACKEAAEAIEFEEEIFLEMSPLYYVIW